MSEDQNEVPGVALTVEGPGGTEQVVAIAIHPPADPDRVMDLVEQVDEIFADEDPEVADAAMAALLLALGNYLRQSPEWPLKTRLDSFARTVQGMVDEAKAHLEDA